MKAIAMTDKSAGMAGIQLVDRLHGKTIIQIRR